MRRILVGFDDSDAARRALDRGIAEARERNARLVVLSVFEMPLVEIEPGEFARTPTGKVVEGIQSADRKVLVGQFGPVEIPFVVRRVGTGWRVDAEPYFSLMNR